MAKLDEARRAAEGERIRMEAARAGEEARRAQALQSARAKHGELRLGTDLLTRKDYLGAAKAFQAFLAKEGDPQNPAVYEAKFGLGRALFEAGMTYSAAGVLTEVLLLGAQRPHFARAFEMVQVVRKRINYAPPLFEQFTKFPVDHLGEPFADGFHYFLGEFFYDYNNFGKARKYLEKVSEGGEYGAKATYLQALILVGEKKYRSAVALFEKAVLLGERDGRQGRSEEVLDLVYLALARIAYEVGNYDGAVYYYRKIPKGSVKVGEALFEAGWTYFLQGNYRNALGVFHGLHSPYLSYRYLPELFILEATAYLNLCNFNEAREAVEVFNDQYASQAVPIKQFLAANPTPQRLYSGFVQAANGDAGAGLPRMFVNAVLGHVEFYNLHKALTAIDRELDVLRVEGQRLGPYGQQLLARAQRQRERLVIETGIKVQQILKHADSELTDLQIKATEVTFEIDSAEKDALSEEVQLAYREGRLEEKAASRDRNAARLLVGSQVEMWPFEGEYWEDELVNYKAFVQEACGE